MPNLFVHSAAEISPCGLYRYWLRRTWDTSLPGIVWIGVNPSTADADKDDATVRRIISFSESWGYGGFDLLNLFALRSTDPRALKTALDPVGPENDAKILWYCEHVTVVAAWGASVPAKLRGRAAAVLKLLQRRDVVCLGKTVGGDPKHPLFVSGKTRPVPFLTA